MYLVFTLMSGESYRRRIRSLLHLCYAFRVLINSLVCWLYNYTIANTSAMPYQWGMEMVQWLERRTRDRNVCGFESRQKRRDFFFFSRVSFPGHSAKSAGGRIQLKTHARNYVCGFAWSDVTWCMVARCSQNVRPDGSSFNWHQPCNNQTAVYARFGGYLKTRHKKLVTHSESDATKVQCVYLCTYTQHTHTRSYLLTHVLIGYTLTHTHQGARAHTRICTYTHTHTHARTHANTYPTHIYKHSCARRSTHTHRHTHTHTHTHTHIHERTHAHIHSRSHTHTHTHAHIHTHARAYTHWHNW